MTVLTVLHVIDTVLEITRNCNCFCIPICMEVTVMVLTSPSALIDSYRIVLLYISMS